MNLFGMHDDIGYRQELREHLLFYSRVTCVVTIVLVLGGIGLDLAFYPDQAPDFALARIGAALLVGLVLLSYTRPWGRRNVRVLTSLRVPRAACVSRA